MMTAWKIMALSDDRTTLISGADSRLRLLLRPGALRMPAPGLWMSTDRDYVLDHYLVHDRNALLELRFSPKDVASGNVHDAQNEFAVPLVHLVRWELLDAEGDPL